MKTTKTKMQEALFADRVTGKLLFHLRSRPLNKFFWEQDKARAFDKVVREKNYEPSQIEVHDLSDYVLEKTAKTAAK